MSTQDRPPHILHCHSTFSAGGKERRAVQLMNAFGPQIRHSVVSAMPHERAALEWVDPEIEVDFPEGFPSLTGPPLPWRWASLAKAMAGFDLILTYNWGAMDAVMSHRLFGQSQGLAALIHHEDGFNEDEIDALMRRRNWFRRAALGKAHSVIVPSKVLECVALQAWHQPRARVVQIPNGIDTARFAAQADPAALSITKGENERWVGTLAGLRPVKCLPALVKAFARLPDNWKLVIVGDGPERTAIIESARQLGIEQRVCLPGAIDKPEAVIGLFDILALSSQSEQFPLSVIEAMAAGLPVAAPAVGDIPNIVAPENLDFITPPNDGDALGETLLRLAHDRAGRAAIGAANQSRASALFDKAGMIERYRAVYERAMGREL